jgi:hypothetical protein
MQQGSTIRPDAPRLPGQPGEQEADNPWLPSKQRQDLPRLTGGRGVVNGFHVQAFGWVLVFNAPGLSRREADEISGLWDAVLRARAEDESQESFLTRLLQPRSVPLSAHSRGAFADLVGYMTTRHPERFSLHALRQRRNHWALQAAFSLLIGFLAATWLPKGSFLTADTVLTLLLLGCGFLIPTLTLWRAASAVKKLRTRQA